MTTSEHLSLDGLTFAAVEVDVHEHIMTLTLNRPDRKNAINEAMVNELIYALDYAKQERAIRVVVIAAKGDTFCAGADLKANGGQDPGQPVSTVPKRGEFDDLALKLYHLNKPCIVKLQGHVYAGALMLVTIATHAIAADPVTFSAPEILRGIWPFQVMGGLFRVMQARAGLDFIMRGQHISAHQAAATGLINQVVHASDLDATVDMLAAELASLAPGSMQLGLKAFRAQQTMSFDEALPYLKQQLLGCLQTGDAKEGITAFIEKRKPEWQ